MIKALLSAVARHIPTTPELPLLPGMPENTAPGPSAPDNTIAFDHFIHSLLLLLLAVAGCAAAYVSATIDYVIRRHFGLEQACQS